MRRKLQRLLMLVTGLCLLTGAALAAPGGGSSKGTAAQVKSGAFVRMEETALNKSKVQYPSEELTVPLTRPLIKSISNIVFAQVPSRGYDNVALKLDLLQPAGPKLKPAVVYVTGGGFINANKDNGLQTRMDLAEAGFVVASIEYRVAPTATFPQPLEDVKAAVRYLRAHAEKFGIDKNHIGLLGGSAGGYLVGIAGTTNGLKQFDVGENLDQSSKVQAVVDLFGVSDLTKIGADYSPAVQKLHESAGATEALWLNGSPVFGGRDGGIKANLAGAELANPLHYISAATPPFLLMHGTADTVVSPSQSDIFYQALREHGVEASRYVVQGAKHGGNFWVQPEISKLIVEFFEKHLK